MEQEYLDSVGGTLRKKQHLRMLSVKLLIS